MNIIIFCGRVTIKNNKRKQSKFQGKLLGYEYYILQF